ncbi:MAG: hypothetical protein ABIE47_13175 [Pseudomonadota bacterium]
MNKIKTFREAFQGRQDVVPRYWQSKKGAGYAPICKNEWLAICLKGKVRNACQDCPNPDYVPLSDQLILDHFNGKQILGVYPLLTNNTCNFTTPDLDNHSGDRDPLKDVLSFHEACEVQEIPTYPLRSKSGNGYHSYTFFNAPVPAWKARAVLFALLLEAGVIGADVRLSSFDRLFPNQDELSGKGLGNLIALPFQGQAARDGHTLFLDPASGFKDPYKDQWALLTSIQKVTEDQLDGLIETWGLKKAEPINGRERVDPERWFKNGIPNGQKHTDFFRYCCQKISQGLAYDEVLILTTELARRCDPLPKDGPEQAALDRVNQAFQKYGDPQNETKKRVAVTFG